MSGLSRAEIVRAENDELKLLPKSAYVLKAELEKQGIEFLEETPESGPGVRWKKPGAVNAFDAAKIRAARSKLGLSQTALAKLASSDRTFIYRIERAVAKSVDAAVLKKLRVALEGAGAEFIPESDQSGAGVRLGSLMSARRSWSAYKEPHLRLTSVSLPSGGSAGNLGSI